MSESCWEKVTTQLHTVTVQSEHELLASQDPQLIEQITSSMIASKDANPHGTVRIAQAKGGRPLPLTPDKVFFQSMYRLTSIEQLTIYNLLNYRTDYNNPRSFKCKKAV